MRIAIPVVVVVILIGLLASCDAPDAAKQPAVVAEGPVGGLEGVAVNARNEPVEGVRISLFPGSALVPFSLPTRRQAAVATTVTRADGSFRLRDVPVARGIAVVGEHDDYARSNAGAFAIEKDTVTRGAVLHMALKDQSAIN